MKQKQHVCFLFVDFSNRKYLSSFGLEFEVDLCCENGVLILLVYGVFWLVGFVVHEAFVAVPSDCVVYCFGCVA